MNEVSRRVARTAIQLVASGGLTALTDVIAKGMAAQTAALVLAGYQVLVTLVHNALEESGTIPAVLKPASVQPPTAAPAPIAPPEPAIPPVMNAANVAAPTPTPVAAPVTHRRPLRGR